METNPTTLQLAGTAALPPVHPPKRSRRDRRDSIERILLHNEQSVASNAVNLDRRHIEEILLENEPEKLVEELKRQCKYRDLIIDKLRESYLRDVILLKEQVLCRDRDRERERERERKREREQTKQNDQQQQQQPETNTTTATTTLVRKKNKNTNTPTTTTISTKHTLKHHNQSVTTLSLPSSHIETNVPSVNLTDCLPFFAPKTHELLFKPCHVCRGNVQLQLITSEDEILLRLHAQKRALDKIATENMKNKQQELEQAKYGGKHLAETLLNELKRTQEELNTIRFERNVARGSVEQLRKTKSYDQLERDYHRLEKYALEKEIQERENQKIVERERMLLKERLEEMGMNETTLNTKMNELSNENQVQKSMITNLEEEKSGLEVAVGLSTAECLELRKEQRTLKRDLMLKTKEKKEEMIKYNLLIDSLQLKMSKIEKKSKRKEEKIQMLETSLKMEKKTKVLERLGKTITKWNLSQLRTSFQTFRHHLFSGSSKKEEEKRQQQEQENEKRVMKYEYQLAEATEQVSLAHQTMSALKETLKEERNQLLMAKEDVFSSLKRKERNRKESGDDERFKMRQEEVFNRCSTYYEELLLLRPLHVQQVHTIAYLTEELRVANDPLTMELHVESATIIQLTWRGYLGRKDAEKMSQMDKLRALEAISMILTRPGNGPDNVDRLSNSLSTEERRVVGSKIIQRTYRSYQAKQEMRKRQFTRDEELKLKATAATMLAASFRGMRGRQGKTAVLRKDRERNDLEERLKREKTQKKQDLQTTHMKAARSILTGVRRNHLAIARTAFCERWKMYCQNVAWAKDKERLLQAETFLKDKAALIDTQNAEQEQLKEENARLVGVSSELERDIQEYMEQMFQLKTDRTSLRKQLMEGLEDVKTLERTVAGLQTEVECLEEKWESEKEKKEQVEEKVSELNLKVKEIQRKKVTSENMLRGRLEKTTTDCNKNIQKNALLMKTLNGLKMDKVKSLKDMISLKETIVLMKERKRKDELKCKLLMHGISGFASTVLEPIAKELPKVNSKVNSKVASKVGLWQKAWRKTVLVLGKPAGKGTDLTEADLFHTSDHTSDNQTSENSDGNNEGNNKGEGSGLLQGLDLENSERDRNVADERIKTVQEAMGTFLRTVTTFQTTYAQFLQEYYPHLLYEKNKKNADQEGHQGEVEEHQGRSSSIRFLSKINFAPCKLVRSNRKTLLKGKEIVRRRLKSPNRYQNTRRTIKEVRNDCAALGETRVPVRANEVGSPSSVGIWEKNDGKVDEFLLSPLEPMGRVAVMPSSVMMGSVESGGSSLHL